MTYTYTPNTNYLTHQYFDSDDSYKDHIQQLQGDNGIYAQLGGIVQRNAEFVEDANKISTAFFAIAEYLSNNGDADVLRYNNREKFVQNLDTVRNFYQNYLKNNRKRQNKMTDKEYQFYGTLGNGVRLLERYDWAVEALKSANETAHRFIEGIIDGSEEEKITQQFQKIGMHGHRPTLHECLFMTPDNTDMQTLFDRFLWLAHNSIYYQDNPSEISGAQDNTIYGHAYQRLENMLQTMPYDKQMEFIAILTRHRLAVQDAGEKRYKQILERIPEDKFYNDPEHHMLAAKRTLKLPAYEEIRKEIDRVAPDFGIKRDKLILEKMKDKPEFAENLKAVTRENLAVMEYSVSEEARANDEMLFIKKQIASDSGRACQAKLILTEGPCKQQIEQRSSKFIDDFHTKVIFDTQGIFKNSVDKEQKSVYEKVMSKREERAARFRRPITDSPVFKQLYAMTENYMKIAEDERKASSSYQAVKDSLKTLFSEKMEKTDDVEYLRKVFADVQTARKNIKVYRDSHSSYRFSDRGQERFAWTAPMAESLEKMETAIRKQIGSIIARNAAKVMSEAVAAGNYTSNTVKMAYARMIFYNSKHDYMPGSEREHEAFLKFMQSESFDMAYSKHLTHDRIEVLAKDPSPTHVNEEIEALNKQIDELNAGNGRFTYTPDSKYLYNRDFPGADLYEEKINIIANTDGLYMHMHNLIKANKKFVPDAKAIANVFKSIKTYVTDIHDNSVVYKFDQREQFAQDYQTARNFLKNYLKNNKKRVNKMSDEEYGFYATVEDDLKQMESCDDVIETVKSANELGRQFREDFMSGAAEGQIHQLMQEIGMHGHRPSIHECLTMNYENTDMKTILDRLVWLAHNLAYHDDNPAEMADSIDSSAYGYAYRRLGDMIEKMPYDKQMEYTILMCKYRMGIHDLGEKKYKEILKDIPEDKIYDDPEYQLEAAKTTLTMPGYEAVKKEIDERYPKSGPEKNKFILEKMKDNPDYLNNLKKISREHLAIMKYSVSEEGISNDAFNDLNRSTTGAGRLAEMMFLFTKGECANKIKNRSSDFIGDFVNGIIANIKGKFQTSTVKERRDVYDNVVASLRENALKHRQPITDSPVFKQLHAMAENYLHLAEDSRKASTSYQAVKDSLKDVFSEDMGKIDNVKDLPKFFNKVEIARNKIKAYRDSHSLHPHSERGQQRMAWTAPMEESLKKLQKAIQQQICITTLKNSGKVFSEALERKDYNSGVVKTAYARMLFYGREQNYIPGSIEESQAFDQFVHSEAFQNACNKLTTIDIKKFAKDPSIRHVNEEIEKMQQYVDKLNVEKKKNIAPVK